MRKELNLSFWTNAESGNSLTHRGGLTAEQIEELKNLKVGDRLILFTNKKRDKDTSPHFNLKVYGGRAQGEGTEGGI